MKKPVLLGTGASYIAEVIRAVNAVQIHNPMVVLLQCNTNYTGEKVNEKHLNINVLKSYRTYFPHLATGLSDHTKSTKAILAAMALGGEFFEKHFTDGRSKSPDNDFALSPIEWKFMVDEMKEFGEILGNTFKELGPNELETMILQRRCLVSTRDINAGDKISEGDMVELRPCPPNGILPDKRLIVGQVITKNISKGDYFRGEHFDKTKGA